MVGLAAAARDRFAAAAPVAAAAALLLLFLAAFEVDAGIAARHRQPLVAVLAVGAGLLLARLRMPRDR
ncbi:hypothetical protein D3C83_211710 [compost metagenome]